MPEVRRRRRFALGFVGGVLVGLVLFTVWLVITGVGVGRDVTGLRASTTQIQSAVAAGNYAAAGDLLQQAQEHAASLDSRLSSPPWSIAQAFPIVGRTLVAGAVLAGATDDVLAHSGGLSSGLAAAAGSDVAVASATLQQVSPELAATAVAAAAAVKQVAAIDTESVLGPVRSQIEQVQQQFLSVVQPVAQGAAVAQVLPGMLGVDAPVRWLVVLGQPSEARGSGGGFFGAYLPVDVSGGRFAPGAPSANDAVAYIEQDLAPLPDEYERLWGSEVAYLWGYNHSRHFPYPASVAARALDPSADYVVALDPAAVAGLMALSGPVTVGGVTLDASNAEMFFARDIYIRYPDPVVKDEVMMAFLQELFVQLGSTPIDPASMWRALAPVVSGSHIQVWSPDAAVASQLEDSLLGGAVPARSGPWVTAAFNNSAGNKIDSYVSSSLTYEAAGDCSTGAVTGTVTATLELDEVPAGVPAYVAGRVDNLNAPYGTSSMMVHVYGPSWAVGRTVEVNGVAVPVVQGWERGHPVWGTMVQLAPGEPAVVRATFVQPAFPGVSLQAVAQPMVQDSVVRVVDERSCRVG